MVLEHSVEENPIPRQTGQVAQEEQQASDRNQYMCITSIEAVWSSAAGVNPGHH